MYALEEGVIGTARLLGMTDLAPIDSMPNRHLVSFNWINRLRTSDSRLDWIRCFKWLRLTTLVSEQNYRRGIRCGMNCACWICRTLTARLSWALVAWRGRVACSMPHPFYSGERLQSSLIHMKYSARSHITPIYSHSPSESKVILVAFFIGTSLGPKFP